MTDDSVEEAEPSLTSPLTWADVKAMKTTRTGDAHLVLDMSRREDLTEAAAELTTAIREQSLLGDDATKSAKSTATKKVNKAEKALHKARADLDAATIVWKMKAIGRKELDDLMGDWPPTRAQVEALRKQLRALGGTGKEDNLLFDATQFQPRLVARCSVQPKITEEEALEMWAADEWSEGECGILWNTAWSLCQAVD